MCIRRTTKIEDLIKDRLHENQKLQSLNTGGYMV